MGNLKIIIDNICNMLQNNIEYGSNGIAETLICWLEDGGTIQQMENLTEADKKECIEYMKRLSPILEWTTNELYKICKEIENKK